MSYGANSPLGAAITVAELEDDPHPVLARLRTYEPVSWIPSLDGWLVTRHDLVLEVMRDPATFTVDDPRFSTGQVIGPSMLSLDGPAHERHRAPFVAPFRAGAVREQFAEAVRQEAQLQLNTFEPIGEAELRRSFAGPLAAAIMARALGLDAGEVPTMLAWYDAIVAGVTEITAGRGSGKRGGQAFAALHDRLRAVIADADPHERSTLLAAAAQGGELSVDQVISNAAVLLFGGIETTEGMIANAIAMLLERPSLLDRVRQDMLANPTGSQLLEAVIEESLRLEPAAAVIDRYAVRDVSLAGAQIAPADLVRLSISAANRDPAVFADPDRFDPDRGPRRHLAFAQGPHVCVGVHLARLEARIALAVLLEGLPGLRLDPDRPARIRGLVFRKPPELWAVWG